MEALQIFSYNNTPVTFKNENGVVFISATEMAKPFGKLPNDYLRLSSTNELIEAIARKNRIDDNQLVATIRGGVNPGTWLHEDIALDFAQWLNIDFKLWCNDRIKELLKHGVTSTESMMEQMISDPDAMINALVALKAEREAKARLQMQNELQQKEIRAISPKAAYYDTVMQSTETYVITRIAQELGLTAIAMNKKLAELKIQRKVDGQWVLYSKYVGNGYTKSHTTTFTKADGTTGTNTQTVWTEHGRRFLHEILKAN